MVGVARDLTREKEKEQVDQEMARLQAFNENLIVSLNDGIQIIDSSGIITFANKRLEDLLEYERGQLLGVHFTEIVATDVLSVSSDWWRQEGPSLGGLPWRPGWFLVQGEGYLSWSAFRRLSEMERRAEPSRPLPIFRK